MMDDPRLAPIRRYENVSAMWGWVAAVSALLLIGFVTLASFNSSNTASNGFTTASRTATPPSTEGSGSSSPQPIAPAPSKSGTQ